MENLITDECIETNEEKMLFHRLFGFLIPDDEQHDGDLIEQYKKYLNNK